jgi:hypothetical protein
LPLPSDLGGSKTTSQLALPPTANTPAMESGARPSAKR